ncbi:predicted protein [Plenodomus lingam JN3]|uniref:Predicted protein n=1 Tax=Leptosphaeria maculans (strain JN3 / isolate v23.1.3 / race Av1-4-5-6-7-8) TaxID=985895 RepID=E5ADW9_LEPMJ|nr:predicted protein [Plenodomus lingam JN3]CBY01408.1 predicted protein [Plenodomus lingam JN3]
MFRHSTKQNVRSQENLRKSASTALDRHRQLLCNTVYENTYSTTLPEPSKEMINNIVVSLTGCNSKVCGKTRRLYTVAKFNHAVTVAPDNDDTGESPNKSTYTLSIFLSQSLLEEELALGEAELDGIVFTLASPRGVEAYFYSRMEGGRGVHGLAMDVGRGWEIEGFVSRDYLSTINNLSPRAWDLRRIQKKGAYYTPKVDGERVPLLKMIPRTSLVVIDAENTVSYGILLIDMLTDYGALWPGTTTSRKMKLEKSIELLVSQNNSLYTSGGDVVFSDAGIPTGVY